MKRSTLVNELAQYDMTAKFYTDGIVEIGKSGIANPLAFFNQNDRGDKYSGEVTVKAINATLFTPTQIRLALELCHEFLNTEERA